MADDLVNAVKQANDIVEVIGEYVSLRKQGRTYKGLCPFHDDHNPSMDVDPGRQRFRCWVCNKFGDVISFIQERERVDFREALEMLARRANIPFRRGEGSAEAKTRQKMLDLMKWAEEQYHRHLLDSAAATEARKYLEGRRLLPETIKKYVLGYAPESWEWLTQRASKAGWPAELLVKVGLSAPRESDNSYYDRFRDRVIFPIRDVRSRTVGLGGRILPSSSSSANAPKYYNSSDTPLFTKSEHLYGLDQARGAGEAAGYLAVVEGYTDVLMAHQAGVMPVVATLGTALNVRHIQQLRRFVPRVVLVFDADAGGERGVDQALQLFVSQEVELAIAALPPGLDPCDLLVQQGPEAFKQVLDGAVDALEFKLARVFQTHPDTIEGRRQAVEAVLDVLAHVPVMAGHTGAVKLELAATRIAQRSGVQIKTLWTRLQERRQEVNRRQEVEAGRAQAEEPPQGPADPVDKALLELVLAEPGLLARLREAVNPEEIGHLGLRRLLQEMYALHDSGVVPEIDLVRMRLSDHPRLAEAALKLQALGQTNPERTASLNELLRILEKRRKSPEVKELQGRLHTVPSDGPVPVELLRQLQEKAGA